MNLTHAEIVILQLRDPIMLWNTKDLRGYAIRASDGDIGEVYEFYFDDEAWVVDYVVVYIGSWVSGKIILISRTFLGQPDNESQILPVALTKEQVENAPDVDTKNPVYRQRQRKLPNNWPAYWGGSRLLIAGAFEVYSRKKTKMEKPSAEEQEADPHLRSTREVIGYRIQANDGKLGHVCDFIVDDRTWAVCSIVVKTRNWLPGREVVLPTQLVEEIRWSKYKVLVNSLRETIRNPP
jgi:uncharacterized protein YrrD